MDGVARTRDDAIISANEKGWKAKILEPCIGVLTDMVDSLKQMDLTICDMKIVGCKVVHTNGEARNCLMRSAEIPSTRTPVFDTMSTELSWQYLAV